MKNFKEALKGFTTILLYIFIQLTYSQSTIYVNSSSGNDANGDGTSGAPYKTFHKGYTSASNGDTIDLTGTFTWTDADETGDTIYWGYIISKNLTIQGQGPGNTTVQAHTSALTADRRVFSITNDMNVIFKNLKIQHGRGWGGYIGTTNYSYSGGAIGSGSQGGSSRSVKLTLENVHISNNYGKSRAAGVYCEGDFSATNCTFDNNVTEKGLASALHLYQNYYDPKRDLISCTFYNNTSSLKNKPAIFFDRSGANIMNCTFLDNDSGITAYAIYNNDEELHITNSIIANSKEFDLFAYSGGDNAIKCTNSIIEVEQPEGKSITYKNCLNGNQTSLNVTTPITNGGNNNLTPYAALASGSVAINAGVTGNFGDTNSGGIIAVPSKDQIGSDRVGTIDIGSYEYTTISPTITFSDINKIYGEANFDLSATSNSGGTISYSIEGTNTTGTTLSGTNNKTVNIGTVGSITIRATQVADGIYSAATKDITLTITKASLTVTADSGQTKVYGATDPALTYTITGFQGTDNESSLDTGVSIARAIGEDVNTYTITPSAASDVNYSVSFVTAQFAITKASQSITFDSLTHTDDVFDLSATTTSGLEISYTSSDTSVATISGKTVTVLKAGSTIITASQSGNNNYHAAIDVSQVLEIQVLGLEESELSNLEIYPNPTSNYLYIRGNNSQATISIYNILGKKVMHAKNINKIDVKGLSNGIYIIRIKEGLKEIIKKFIKK